ncbi:MAG TPA: hypothetical protein VHH36_07995, partial [Candidatus Thermoplasmatota archaeon]|nr:hypothetical protein [Candidatus Thermoplasmatota archaeon]
LAAAIGAAALWAALVRRRAPEGLPPPRGAVPERASEVPQKKRIKDLVRERGRHVTIRREVVRSKPELRIANFLHKRGVRYEYEPQLPGATPDFYLPDSNIVLEHWGMEHTRYLRRRMEKTRIYRARGYVLVETEKRDLPRLERVLEARLLKADPHVFERGRRPG